MPRELIVSPRGEALWAKVLGEPTAFEDNPKAWSVSLVLDPSDPETIAFTERLEKCFEEFHGPKAKISRNGWPFGEQTTKDDKGRQVPTGKIEFRFKRKEMTAKGKFKDAPVVVDSKKNLWPQEQLIGNGSKIKVAFTPWGWEMAGAKGMSLELEQVQVLELVEYAGRDADPFAEEDGYVVETPAAQSAFEKEEEPEAESFAAKLRARAAEVQAESADVLEEIPF
jgi:hypothetical protein